jgi:hypothetical protein
MMSKERSHPINKLKMLVSSWQYCCCWWDAFGVWVSCVAFVLVLCVCGSGVSVLINSMTMVYELLKHSYIMGSVGIMCQLGDVFYICSS